MKKIRLARYPGFRRPAPKDAAAVAEAHAEWLREQAELAAFDGRALTDAETEIRQERSAYLVNDGWTEILVRTSDGMVVFYPVDHADLPADVFGLGAAE